MAENINIGGRLHSIATGNVVAGANEILDDAKGKKQSQINTETDAALEDRYTKAETYSKTQLDNMITTPEIAYKDYDTYADMVAETVHPAGAIYRVANYDGTQVVTNKYAEYSWDGTQYKLMAVRDHGIDDEPTAGSENLVTSGGVYEAIGTKSEMPLVDEDGFHVVDENLNIGMKYDEAGLDAAKVSSHFIEVLKAAGVSADDVMTSYAAEVNEDGFFIIDESLNVGVKIDNDGIHSKNILEYEIIEN